MKLVLPFFGIILIIFLILKFSKIRLNIEQIYISNIEQGKKQNSLNQKFLIYLEIYIIGLRVAKIKLTKERLQKFKFKKDVKSIEKDVKVLKQIKVFDDIKKIKTNAKSINLNLAIGTESLNLTIYLVTILSSIIAIIIGRTNCKERYFKVVPLYNTGNVINFNLNCIIEAKVVHIIYVIYILFKKGRNVNERSSDRRSYDYSYE